VILWLDTETYSPTPIQAGTYKYAANCEVDIIAYAVDDGPVDVLDMTLRDPHDVWMFQDLVAKADEIVAHNAMFDRNVLRLGNLKIETLTSKWRCCMVKGMAHGLPGGLEKQGDILGIDSDKKKLKDGKALMMLFCKPRPKNMKLRRATRETHPAEWARYLEYARNDVAAMREIWKKLPSWNYGQQEIALWHLDQMINDRGFQIDTEFAEMALVATDREQELLAKRAVQMTNGYLEAATQRDRVLQYILGEYGYHLPDLQKATLERLLTDDRIEEGVKDLLRLRLSAGTTSTAKYKTLVKAVGADGRLRGTLQFDGAARTRRDAGRIFQPQNLPSRGLMPNDQVQLGIEAVRADCADMLYPDVMHLLSSAIRGTIIAPPGKKLVIADLANIEGRDAAWLAGEDWKCQAFREYDEGTGPDLYKLAYARSFGMRHEDVTKDQRSVGKVQELAGQYQGSLGAFMTFAAGYNIDLDEMAERAYPTIPEAALREATGLYDWYQDKGISTYGLRAQTAIVILCFVQGWRQGHPAISSYWKELEHKVALAIDSPGKTFEARKCKIRRDGAWLRILMPSGRYLCYPHPQVDDKGKISYMGVDQFTKKWTRIPTYGGRIFENLCQSFARDVLFDHMPTVELAGYKIVLRVHDELVTEAPDTDEFSSDQLSALISTPLNYCADMPLAAAGFTSYRYRKD
jgi:DNA polymerase